MWYNNLSEDVRVMGSTDFNFDLFYEYYRQQTLKEGLYVLLDKEELSNVLKENELLLINEDNLDGFILYNVKGSVAFITLFYGSTESLDYLFETFEKRLLKENVKHIWFNFNNPTSMSWYPLEGIEHPMIQGIVLDSEKHNYLLSKGFEDYVIEDTYYRSLIDFKIPDEVVETIQYNETKGYKIEFYNKEKHTNLEEFCDLIHNEDWKNVILTNEAKNRPLPLLVVTYLNDVIGYAGPLKREESGRGYFAGIGVLNEYRGNKLGKTLFNRLCEELKNLNSEYMTLFTGRNNPAKHIYIQRGFKVVQSFMLLKKDLNLPIDNL